jgi:hypothetical protein
VISRRNFLEGAAAFSLVQAPKFDLTQALTTRSHTMIYEWLKDDSRPGSLISDWFRAAFLDLRPRQQAVANAIGVNKSVVSDWVNGKSEIPCFNALRFAEHYCAQQNRLVRELARLHDKAQILRETLDRLGAIVRREGASTTPALISPEAIERYARRSARQVCERLGRGRLSHIVEWGRFLHGATWACRFATATVRLNDPHSFMSSHTIDQHLRSETQEFVAFLLAPGPAYLDRPENSAHNDDVTEWFSEQLCGNVVNTGLKLLCKKQRSDAEAWTLVQIFYLSCHMNGAGLDMVRREIEARCRRQGLDEIVTHGIELSHRLATGRSLANISTDALAHSHLAFDLYFFGRSFDGLPSIGVSSFGIDKVTHAIPYMILDLLEHDARLPHRRDLEFGALKLATETFGQKIFSNVKPHVFVEICEDISRFSPDQREWAYDRLLQIA